MLLTARTGLFGPDCDVGTSTIKLIAKYGGEIVSTAIAEVQETLSQREDNNLLMAA